MLPNIFNEWISYRPKNRNELKVKEFEYLFDILTIEEAKDTLNKLSIKKTTVFYEFYITYIGTDSSEQEEADLMYNLSEILENYKKPFWSKYLQIGERYLQLSSIEGEYSYFYDKKTDALYGVDWGEMDDFIAGKLNPLFTSFYDFLEWYYTDEDEE